jgi:tRNA(Arg) A34 adenosine deaminase TadA
MMNETDLKFMRAAIDVAWKARGNGNHPFGAVLVDEDHTEIMAAENTVVTEKDVTGHAETNLVRIASKMFDPEYLAKCTIYTSTEPCPMCAGAIFWLNVRRVVYGLSMDNLYKLTGADNEDALDLQCRELFEKGRKPIEVIGPLLEEEAKEVHAGFWS